MEDLRAPRSALNAPRRTGIHPAYLTVARGAVGGIRGSTNAVRKLGTENPMVGCSMGMELKPLNGRGRLGALVTADPGGDLGPIG